MIVAAGHKATSSSDDVLICRSVIDADLQYAEVVCRRCILFFQIVVLSEGQHGSYPIIDG